MPKKSSTYGNSNVWNKTLLGKNVNEELYYEIKIKKEDIRKYL